MGHNLKKQEVHQRFTCYSCTFVFRQVRILEKNCFNHIPIVKRCPVQSVNLDFRSTQNTKNENPMTIYIPIRFNIFLVSEKNYILVTDFPRKLETFAVTNNIPPNLIQLR